MALEAAFLLNEYTTDLLHYCFILLLVINTTFVILRSNSNTNLSTDFYIEVEEMETVTPLKDLILKSIECSKIEAYITIYSKLRRGSEMVFRGIESHGQVGVSLGEGRRESVPCRWISLCRDPEVGEHGA